MTGWGVKIIDQETVDMKRKIKEVTHIRRHRSTLNKRWGLWLIHVTTLSVHCYDEDYARQSKATILKSLQPFETRIYFQISILRSKMRIHGIINFFFFMTALTEFYVETICDGDPARTLKCPPQFVISTVWASYGRHLPDTCIEDDQLINTTCHADYENTILSVQESCDDSNSCTLVSSKEEYEDPPECQGVRKYLQVYYLCKSGKLWDMLQTGFHHTTLKIFPLPSIE